MNNFWRQRKQHNTVKIAVTLFVVTAAFLVSGIVNICQFLAAFSSSVEYILIPDSTASLAAEKIDRLSEAEDAIAASLHRRYTIAVGSGEAKKPLAVSEVSNAYLAKAFNIETDRFAAKTFFCNKSAFALLFALSAERSQRGLYSADSISTHQALFVLCDNLSEDAPYAYHAGASATLNSQTADSVLVLYQSTDITDARERRLKNDGFATENRLALLKTSYEKELLLKTLLYDLIIILISLVSGITLINRCKNKSF